MDKKYEYGTEENRALLKRETENLLGFGHKFPAPGGGSAWLDNEGNPDPSHGIQTWITCRMAHVYSLGTLLDPAVSVAPALKAAKEA